MRLSYLPFVLGIVLCSAPAWGADSWPTTRAERTDYQETSHYEEVIEFLDGLVEQGAPISVEFIGQSPSGRRIPMVVAGRPLLDDPAAAKRSGRPIVCIQANIHAGEVEGKEASLMLLRDLSKPGQGGGLLKKLVLIVLPIYNIDGNEEFGPQAKHRPHQLGPDWVGVRSNGQGLDLNRDYVKLEAPETRAVVEHVFKTWDPHVFLDLHATNGTLHGYPLTYAPPLHPDTAKGVLDYTRDELLPSVRKEARNRYGLELFDYGNTPRWDFADKPFAWYASRPAPRYSTNYIGLRNRIAVLSEAMSHLPFEERVQATYRFVHLILEQIAKDADRVIELTSEADRQIAELGRSSEDTPELGLRFEQVSRGRETILLDKSETPALRDQKPIDRPPGPPENIVEFETDIITRFAATRTRRLPAGYLFGSELVNVAELLRKHGILVEEIDRPWQGEVETFRIESIDRSERPYQGHRLVTLEGNLRSEQRTFPKGSYLVRTTQPLGLLLFQLLEPESLDGVATWNLLDEHLEVGTDYPIVKCYDLDVAETRFEELRVTAPPAELELDRFYAKYVSANGYPVVSSAKVDDYALKEAGYLINMMLAKRPDVRDAMIASGSRMVVMAHDEFTTDVPEQREMKPKNYWDVRARGLGGSQRDPLCSCGEENLLGFDGDPYAAENILIHEFAHNMHLRGLVNVDPTFDERLEKAYDQAMEAGLWKGKYASINHHEYFAEGVQSWFSNNREPDHDHNHVNTREELIEYDPGLAAICEEVFGDTKLVYMKPATRLHGHMAGYDPAKAPKFVWPERVLEAQRKIREDAQRRSEGK